MKRLTLHRIASLLYRFCCPALFVRNSTREYSILSWITYSCVYEYFVTEHMCMQYLATYVHVYIVAYHELWVYSGICHGLST
jgi:hypothetical protein